MSIDPELIRHYFDGRCSEEEQKAILALISSADQEEELKAVMRDQWNKSDRGAIPDEPDFKQLLGKIHETINAENDTSRPHQPVLREIKRRPVMQWLVKIAAVFLLPALLAGAYYFFNPSLRVKVPPYISQVNPPAKRTTINLPDGSTVWLNSESSLKYLKNFEGSKREVYLEGEAFFNVTKSSKPFIVNTADFSVQVLGTKFNVNAFPQDSGSEITLSEGSVKIMSHHKKSEIKLKPGEQAVFSKKTKLFTLDDVNAEQFSCWREGKLILKNESLDKVFAKLERWYGVKINHNTRDKAYDHFTLKIENETLREVLDLINSTTPISYTIQGNKVYINFPMKEGD